eukprot:1184390-Prorocentrum_minimum.AAC.2
MGCGATKEAAARIGAAEGGPSKPVDPVSLLDKEIVIKDLERRSDLNGVTAKVEHYIKVHYLLSFWYALRADWTLASMWMRASHKALRVTLVIGKAIDL